MALYRSTSTESPPEEPEKDATAVLEPQEVPAQEPPAESIEPAPAVEPPADEPEPTKPSDTVSDDQYSNEEWEKMSPEDQQKAWDDYYAAQDEEFKRREAKLKKEAADLAKRRSETDREFHERMEKVKRLAEEKNVADEYDTTKKIDRAIRKDPAKIFDEIKIEPIVTQPQNRPYSKSEIATNVFAERIIRRSLKTMAQGLAPQLALLNMIQEGVERSTDFRKSQDAWIESMKGLMEEYGFTDPNDPIIIQAGDTLVKEEMDAIGSILPPKAREATLRRILSEVGKSNGKPVRPVGKTVQFPARPQVPLTRISHKPPRRAPSTMGTRGGTSGKPEPQKRSVIADMAAGIDAP